MMRQQVPDHRTCHGECRTSERTATMTFNDGIDQFSVSVVDRAGLFTFNYSVVTGCPAGEELP